MQCAVLAVFIEPQLIVPVWLNDCSGNVSRELDNAVFWSRFMFGIRYRVVAEDAKNV